MDKDNNLKNSAHPLYLALRAGNIEKFNAMRANGEKCDFTFLNFRDVDMRGANLAGLDFSNAYLRQADLRGQDLRSCNLEGASIRAAKVSGTYFPTDLAPEEITMSLNHGTRLRCR